jgi:hypothetical protein
MRKYGLTSHRAGQKAVIGTAVAHVKYLHDRPGEDKNRGERDFFDESNDKISGKETREWIRTEGKDEKVIHKLLLAPDVNPADKHAFAREVMKELSARKGQELQWKANIHTNTDNHHVNVVVLGRDKNGKEVRFDPKDYDVIKEVGDRYLDREHPLERELKQRERDLDQRAKAERRISYEANRLPWMVRGAYREMYDPYEKWKARDLEKVAKEKAERESGLKQSQAPDQKKEKNNEREQEKFTFEGKEYSENSSWRDLKQLTKDIRDSRKHPDKSKHKSLPDEDKKMLYGWLDAQREEFKSRQLEKVNRQEPEPEPKAEPDKQTKEEKEKFTFKGRTYSEDTPLEQLKGLAKNIRDSRSEKKDELKHSESELERMVTKPNLWAEEKIDAAKAKAKEIEDKIRDPKQTPYKDIPEEHEKKLHHWIEDKDRKEWSERLAQGPTENDERNYESAASKGRRITSQRAVDPQQQAIMSNPAGGAVVAIIKGVYDFAKSVVDDVPTDWFPKDQVKETRADMEDLRRAKYDAWKDRQEKGQEKQRDNAAHAHDAAKRVRDSMDKKLEQRAERQYQNQLKRKETKQKLRHMGLDYLDPDYYEDRKKKLRGHDQFDR